MKKCANLFSALCLALTLCLTTPLAAAPVPQVNLNTANQETLQKLPHVGPAISQRIIKYRQDHGAFKKPADIQKVKGIGEKTFADLKDHILVESSH